MSLLGRILTKFKVEEVSDALFIAPWWPTAHWYPPLLQLLVQRSILLPQRDKLLTLPQEDFLHPLKNVMRLPSPVACIRDNLQVRGISPRAASFVLKSWRPGTEKQYSAAWKCFCCWCDRKQREPLEADLRTVCDFLTEQFEDFNKSYSTINSYRSALSLLYVIACRWIFCGRKSYYCSLTQGDFPCPSP